MKTRIIKSIITFLIVIYSSVLSAHEMWLEPENFILKKNTELRVNIKVGVDLAGDSYPYIRSETKNLRLFLDKTQIKLKHRDGDYPAIKSLLKKDGLYILSYQSSSEKVSYKSFSQFKSFLIEQNLWDYWSTKYPELINTQIEETYTRYAKSLVQVDKRTGKDFNTNLNFEIIALNNPYISTNKKKIQILVMYKNKPHINSQVTIFNKLNNKVTIKKIKTNNQGKAFVDLKSKGLFLISCVHFIQDYPNWRSLWASLTFQKK